MEPILILPSADPVKAKENLPKWRERGWFIAVLVDNKQYLEAHREAYEGCAIIVVPGEYHGYPWAIREILKQLPKYQSVLAAGEDMWPPDIDAAALQQMYLTKFPTGLGVLQCTGDRWMTDASGLAASERICGSPMFGNEYIRRANMGKGPFWPGMYHFFADEVMLNTARRDGILWQVNSLTIHHDHWHRAKRDRPPHMNPARDSWAKDKAEFERLKAANWAGTEMLPT